MAKYELLISRSAEKSLDKVPKRDRIRLVREIEKLAIDPRPRGSRKLTGEVDTYRVRVGVYRIVYEIEDNILRVLVLKIGNRKDIYR